MAGKGQPPKRPEDKRKDKRLMLSPNEVQKIEKARQIEAPQKKFSSYIRDVTLDHVEQVLKNQ